MGILKSRFTEASLISIGVIGLAGFLVLPTIISALITDLELDKNQVGYVSTLQLIGLALGSACSLKIMSFRNWQNTTRIGLFILLVADIFPSFASNYEMLLVCRCVSVVAYALGQTEKAEKSYGIFLATQATFAIVGNMALPLVTNEAGLAGLFILLVAIEVILLLFVTNFAPAKQWKGSEPKVVDSNLKCIT